MSAPSPPSWAIVRARPGPPDAIAPDGSEIRLLVRLDGASVVHCTLPPGQVTRAVRHRHVEEVWYVLAGGGQVWRRAGDREEVVDVAPGAALTIPRGTHFQFRAADDTPLVLLIATVPPWPGEDEAVPVEGVWTPRLHP